jgi:Transposase DDE domain
VAVPGAYRCPCGYCWCSFAHQPDHTRALAALFATSQSTVDRIIHHLIPVLAAVLRPTPDCRTHPWIIDGTLIPVHDQSITAISKKNRRSVNTQILINANNRRVIAVGPCWPGNRNDVVVARRTVADLIDDSRTVLDDGGYRGITIITGPRRRPDGRIIRDHHYRAHRPIRARVEHVTARIKDRQILRQCRRRGEAINHSLHIITGLWNLKGCGQLRVNS